MGVGDSMFGILCSSGSEMQYAKMFAALLKKSDRKYPEVIIFTLSNVDVGSKTVKGTSIIKGRSKPRQVALPSIIFNYSIQKKMSNRKKIRALYELDHIEILNVSNRFNQWMMLKILASSPETAKYVLPHVLCKKEELREKLDTDENYLCMPKKGANTAAIQYLSKGIEEKESQREKIFLKVPDISNEKEDISVIRVYLQRGLQEQWTVIGSRMVNGYKDEKCIASVDSITLLVINYITKFIHNMGTVFIDFFIDEKGNLFFLHLGGWDQSFFQRVQNKQEKKIFALALKEYYLLLQSNHQNE